MFELSVKTHFSAAHHLRGYAGACANPHGHNWEIEVFVRGEGLDRTGFLVDFRELKARLRSVLGELDHRDLNALPVFLRRNPTSENLAHYLFDSLAERFDAPRCRVHRVTVCETPGTAASYWASETRRIPARRGKRGKLAANA